MKKFLLSAVLTMTLACFSCSNNDEPAMANVTNDVNITVKKMGDYLNTHSRSLEDSVLAEMPVLQFKDKEDFDNTVKKLQAMTQEDREEYFKKYSYESACMFIDRVDSELDQVFEVDDSVMFVKCLDYFLEKYKDVISFDPEDKEDYTPYLSFTDSSMSLVGNALGYVVIDNELVGPADENPDYEESRYDNYFNIDFENNGTEIDLEQNSAISRAWQPIQPGFKAFKNAEIAIKKGKYRSTMNIGRIVNGNSFAVKCQTKKKVFFVFKKSVKTHYSCILTLKSTKFDLTGPLNCPSGIDVVILNVPIERVGMTFNAIVKDFKSGKCTNPGSRTFNNLKVI